MPKYHVEFDIVSSESWYDDDTAHAKTLEYYPNTSSSWVYEFRIPSYAEITEVASPYTDGYFLAKGSSNVFKRKGGAWFINDSSMGWIHLESTTDDYANSQGATFLAPLVEDSVS